MPLFSWFPLSKPQQEGGHNDTDEVVDIADLPSPYVAPDVDTIADGVEALQRELAYACHLCEQANLQFDRYRVDIQELKDSVATLRQENDELRHRLATEKDRTLKYRTQVQQDQVTIRTQNVLVTKLQARLNKETVSVQDLTRHTHTLEQRMVDTQLDLEYLKCTANTDQHMMNPPEAHGQDAPLPAQPFVVVLVDGDAYKWNPQLFMTPRSSAGSCESDRSEPGGLAATRIRNEVVKYIMKQNGTIPITSKVITRVFCNFGYERQFLGRQRRSSTPIALTDFAVQFTEKMPLFDYFDAGRGKERADDKIRGMEENLTPKKPPRAMHQLTKQTADIFGLLDSIENFHLYLSTPNCHAVFVAACLDNGFARMLEQYSNHPLAFQKIVLVTPGYMGLEIQKLGFNQVMWSSVFATMTMSKALAIKYEKGLQKRHKESLNLLNGFTTRSKWAANKDNGAKRYAAAAGGVGGGEDVFDVARFLLDQVPVWDVNDALAKYSHGVGLRIPFYRGNEDPSNTVMEQPELESKEQEEVD